MTDEEMTVYKLLGTPEDKEEFIREFWRIRDPDATTEVNEARVEFESRIKYATQFFSRNPISPRQALAGKGSGRGWNNDMGRMYIILGPPDSILDQDDSDFHTETMDRWKQGMPRRQIWRYHRFDFGLAFIQKPGHDWAIDETYGVPPGKLLQAMDFCKLNLIQGGAAGDLERVLNFKAEYRDGNIVILIPIKRVNFVEADGRLQAKLHFRITVYRDARRIDLLEKDVVLADVQENLEKKTRLETIIPYSLSGRGQFLLDILASDVQANVSSIWRRYVKTRG